MNAEKECAQLREQAKMWLLRKQFGKARGALNRALELSPGDYKLHRLRGIAHAALSDHAAALQDADEVVGSHATNSDAWYQKGHAHFHLKQFSSAAKAFSQGLALNPADRMLQQGFWDSMMLMSQSRTDTAALSSADQALSGGHGHETEVLEVTDAEAMAEALTPSTFSMGGSLLKTLLSRSIDPETMMTIIATAPSK